MKKNSKSKILSMHLSRFDIKPLTDWVYRRQRKWAREMERVDEEMVGKSSDEKDKYFRAQMDKKVETVGCLIRNYPYRFRSRWLVDGRRGGVGLGRKTIEELKKKLLALGLTPDDWPALVEHNELLEKLSKEVIMGLPIQEVFVTSGGYGYKLHGFMGCSEDELGTKTVKDFISIDPRNVQGAGARFIKHRKRQFIAIRQKLATKGFTTRDGAFFKWNPEISSRVKATDILRKYNLRSSELKRFAEIAVAERWVI